jgi:transposase
MGVATIGEPSMQAVTTVGLDIAKSVFQVHGIDATGNVVIRRQLKRRHVLAFFQKLYRRASSVLRPVQRRITGRESSRRSAIRCG